MTDATKKIVLIDGSSYLYRAFHALPPLTNTQGQPTGAIYGVVSMIKKLLTDYHPDFVAVVFDPKGKTHRDAVFADYKMHRPAMPSDLSLQVQPLFEIVKAMGLPLIVHEGIEADDVIATFTIEATKLGWSTIISTGDKDMAQLVGPKVNLINTMSGTWYDRDAVIKKFGIPPELVVDYLALIGDKVDNIPGIPGVGPKTAVKWLNDYGSFENILEHAAAITGKVGDNLRDHLAELPLSKQLVTLMTDLELPEKVTDLIPKEMDSMRLIELYKNLEFKTWLAELLENAPQATKVDYPIIYDEPELISLLERLEKSETYGIYLQATSEDAMRANCVGIAIALASGQSFYIPLTQEESLIPSLTQQFVFTTMQKCLQDSKKTVVTEDSKFFLNVFAKEGVTVSNKLYDTRLESYVQNSSVASHDVNSLALKYLGYRPTHFGDLVGKGAKKLTLEQLPIDQVASFAAQRADMILQLHEIMWEKISQDTVLQHLLTDIELPLSRVLAKMEFHGVLINAEMLHAQSAELNILLRELEQKAFEEAGCQFNLGSPKQLQSILYEKLQLPILSKTPTGQPSTSESVLQELAASFALPRILLEHRSLNKIKTTYTDRLPLQINPTTGRVHTSYQQAVTATGRLSSTDPNLQNIPVRTEQGRRIRQAIVPPPGFKILSADYSQIELRIMAHLTQDPGLLKAFELGLDIHTATAAEVFGVDLSDVTSLQRRSAKVINFGLIYGMSSFGLASQLGLDRHMAQDYINRYFERYTHVRDYMESTRQLAHQQGYVETLLGRRVYLPEINVANLQRQRAAERAAINAPLQGTAADIIKIAMLQIDECLQNYQSKMIMQVHDELVFEVLESELVEVTEIISQCMTHAMTLSVPLVVAIGVGNNWDEAH